MCRHACQNMVAIEMSQVIKKHICHTKFSQSNCRETYQVVNGFIVRAGTKLDNSRIALKKDLLPGRRNIFSISEI